MTVLGTVDVVLFNPLTMQYDGDLISGVPIRRASLPVSRRSHTMT